MKTLITRRNGRKIEVGLYSHHCVQKNGDRQTQFMRPKLQKTAKLKLEQSRLFDPADIDGITEHQNLLRPQTERLQVNKSTLRQL